MSASGGSDSEPDCPAAGSEAHYRRINEPLEGAAMRNTAGGLAASIALWAWCCGLTPAGKSVAQDAIPRPDAGARRSTPSVKASTEVGGQDLPPAPATTSARSTPRRRRERSQSAGSRPTRVGTIPPACTGATSMCIRAGRSTREPSVARSTRKRLYASLAARR